MSYVKSLVVALIATATFAGAARPAGAGVIEYEARDLPDVLAGQDLWEYEYFLSGFVFGLNEGFTIYASDTLYRELVIPAAPGADWDAVAFEPDVVLGSAGGYDALAQVPAPSLVGPFVLNFVWLGAARGPGSQPYEIYALDPQGALTVIDEGRTVSRSVPEPAVLGLMGLAGVAAARFVRRRRAV